MSKSFLLCEKYAPQTIKELILPKTIKNQLSMIKDTGNIPNMLLYGEPGAGKTQSVRCLANELDATVLFVNGSNEGRKLDFIREKIPPFAASVGFTEGRKIVLFDEFDNTTQDVQLLLRSLIEQHQSHCSFIFTCNEVSRINDAIKSRTTPLYYKYQPKEKKEAVTQFAKRLIYILGEENITFDKKALVEFVVHNFGNWRGILNKCQSYVGTNAELDLGILAAPNTDAANVIFKNLKSRNIDNIREYLSTTTYTPTEIIQIILDPNNLKTHFDKNSIPSVIVISSKYLDYLSRSLSNDIHLLAYFVELCSCNFI